VDCIFKFFAQEKIRNRGGFPYDSSPPHFPALMMALRIEKLLEVDLPLALSWNESSYL
jgi:hypothetical protein